MQHFIVRQLICPKKNCQVTIVRPSSCWVQPNSLGFGQTQPGPQVAFAAKIHGSSWSQTRPWTSCATRPTDGYNPVGCQLIFPTNSEGKNGRKLEKTSWSTHLDLHPPVEMPLADLEEEQPSRLDPQGQGGGPKIGPKAQSTEEKTYNHGRAIEPT